MYARKSLKLEGLSACISVRADPDFYAALPAVFSGWHFVLLDSEGGQSFADIALDQGVYTLSSPFMDAPEVFQDPVNTLCRAVVEIAWQQLRENPELLCLHGAAIEAKGRLVLFPSVRRAGKSTLSVGLLAAGFKLFTDDFLPLRIAEDAVITGLAQGISPRLRLPLPNQIGAVAGAYIERQGYTKNRQYRYVVPAAGDAARNGAAAPIGALVFLKRDQTTAPHITKVEPAEALEALIKQNFSRAMNAPAILKTLSVIAQKAPAYALTYDDVEPAVKALDQLFENWPSAPPTMAGLDNSSAPAPPIKPGFAGITNRQSLPLTRAPGIAETITGTKRFLCGDNNRTILSLNEGAARIWHLLEKPISAREITEILALAFPDEDPARLERDTQETLDTFLGRQLVVWYDEKSEGGEMSQPPEFSSLKTGLNHPL